MLNNCCRSGLWCVLISMSAEAGAPHVYVTHLFLTKAIPATFTTITIAKYAHFVFSDFRADSKFTQLNCKSIKMDTRFNRWVGSWEHFCRLNDLISWPPIHTWKNSKFVALWIESNEWWSWLKVTCVERAFSLHLVMCRWRRRRLCIIMHLIC